MSSLSASVRQTPGGPRIFVDGKPVRPRFFYGSPTCLCNISSEKNGLRTTKSGADGRGNLVISGGDHRIIAGRHAFLVGRGDLYVYNCRIFDKSIVSTWNVGGQVKVQSGCIQ